jgi:hypothetical protein
MHPDYLTDGCLCGAVRYRTALPASPATLCHCASCRRATGAHMVGLYTVPRDTLTFTRDLPADYRSSTQVLRAFCGRCGTSLSYWHALWPHEISMTVATLDQPALTPAIDHTWMADALAWDEPADGLPQHLTDRG